MLTTFFVLSCVAVGVVLTGVAIFLDENSMLMFKSLLGGGGKEELAGFQRTYLAVYLFAMMADWLQGPFVYALYESYGFSREDNATLFVCGFGSSFLFGTFIGSLADKYGRRNFAALYCVLYIVSCMTKHVNSFSVLMIGRITGGIATSLLFSVFDTWLVSESNARGFSGDQLGATFSIAMFGNSVVAIAAGEIGQVAADMVEMTPISEGSNVFYGKYTAPFDLAIAVLCVALVAMWSKWPENYGESSASSIKTADHGFGALAAGAMELAEQPTTLCCGIVCALFESSMFIFVFNWTPCVMEPDQPPPPFGHIFAGFMIMSMLGSRVFSYLTQTMSIETVGMYTMLVAAVCHLIPIVFGSVIMNFFAFLAFELCVGMYFPMMGTLKGQVVKEELRSTIYNIFRLPLNAIVVMTLVMKFSTATSFTITTSMLIMAFAAQYRLRGLRKQTQEAYASVEKSEAGVDAIELGKRDDSNEMM